MNLPNLHGKLFIVTGANIGLGLQTTKNLCAAGATVAMACRNQQKAQAAAAEIVAAQPDAKIEHVRLDLSDYTSVRAAAADILARFSHIDGLVNNAGLFFDKHSLNGAGHEMTIATNHLGPFLLTNLLLDRLKATPGARIVNVASEAHRMGKVKPDDLHADQGLVGWNVYGTSKLCNILFTQALATRLAGSGVTVTCCHPGFVASNFGETNKTLMDRIVGWSKVFAISPQKGAQTQTWLAASPDVAGKSGGYYANCKEKKPSKAGRDAALAEQLWAVSVGQVGLG